MFLLRGKHREEKIKRKLIYPGELFAKLGLPMIGLPMISIVLQIQSKQRLRLIPN
jgi:hypothetical protein